MDDKLIKEACVENFIEVKKAISGGADRIELNDNMSNWGTTPSFGTIKKTVQYSNKFTIPVIVMNRPRGGDFIYSAEEKEIMMSDLDVMIQLGADGVAFGALNEKNELDKAFLKDFIKKSKKNNLEITFHRAFDSIPFSQQKESLQWLAKHNVNRIASHGGSDSTDILDNVKRLKELNELEPSIQIMAGGGITKDNFEKLVNRTGLIEIHGTKLI